MYSVKYCYTKMLSVVQIYLIFLLDVIRGRILFSAGSCVIMLLYHYLYVNILPYIRVRSLVLCTTSSVRRLYYLAQIHTSHARRLFVYILSKFFVTRRDGLGLTALDQEGTEGPRDRTRRGA